MHVFNRIPSAEARKTAGNTRKTFYEFSVFAGDRFILFISYNQAKKVGGHSSADFHQVKKVAGRPAADFNRPKKVAGRPATDFHQTKKFCDNKPYSFF
jgi:hypothetical protein